MVALPGSGDRCHVLTGGPHPSWWGALPGSLLQGGGRAARTRSHRCSKACNGEHGCFTDSTVVSGCLHPCPMVEVAVVSQNNPSLLRQVNTSYAPCVPGAFDPWACVRATQSECCILIVGPACCIPPRPVLPLPASPLLSFGCTSAAESARYRLLATS